MMNVLDWVAWRMPAGRAGWLMLASINGWLVCNTIVYTSNIVCVAKFGQFFESYRYDVFF